MSIAHAGESEEKIATRLMILFGSVSYGDTDGMISDNFRWHETTGEKILSKKEFLATLVALGFTQERANQLYDAIESQHALAGFSDDLDGIKKDVKEMREKKRIDRLIKRLTDIGISTIEIERLVSNDDLNELYNKLAEFSNKPDFAHMMMTSATELSNAPSFLASIGARGNAVKASGWLGDVSTIAFDREPSMGNDDYKADLDAVNIARRIRHAKASFDDTLRQYYNELDSDVTNRAQEFQRHYKVKDIINEINSVDTSGKYTTSARITREIVGSDDGSLKKILNETAQNFVYSLEQGSNDYITKVAK